MNKQLVNIRRLHKMRKMCFRYPHNIILWLKFEGQFISKHLAEMNQFQLQQIPQIDFYFIVNYEKKHLED